MEYIRIAIVGIESRQEANDVADHQNDIGRQNHDRRVVFAGEGDKSKMATPEWAPLIFVAVATTKAAIKEIRDEFFSKVPIVLEWRKAEKNA